MCGSGTLKSACSGLIVPVFAGLRRTFGDLLEAFSWAQLKVSQAD